MRLFPIIRLAILATGSGSTAEFVYRATMPGGMLHGIVEVVCLVTWPGAGVINRLHDAGFTGEVYELDTKHMTEGELADQLLRIFYLHAVSWFGQYGWIPRTPARVSTSFRGINQHPAPVPLIGGTDFYGLTPHRVICCLADLLSRSLFTEATAQLVDQEYDKGIRLVCVPYEVVPGTKPEVLQKQLLKYEHLCQVFALLRVASYGGNTPPEAKSYLHLEEKELSLLEAAKAIVLPAFPHGK